MNDSEMNQIIQEFAEHIIQIPNFQSIVLMGMATRGIPIAERVATYIKETQNIDVEVGHLDATFYRDDFHFRKKLNNPQMRVTQFPKSIDQRQIILFDDVLYTGRSVRAAMESIMDLGRPANIKLFVLVDRGHRELPIEPNATGKTVVTEQDQEIRVKIQPVDDIDEVLLVKI